MMLSFYFSSKYSPTYADWFSKVEYERSRIILGRLVNSADHSKECFNKIKI